MTRVYSCLTALVLLVVAAAPVSAQLPLVNPANRASVVNFWETVYLASEGEPMSWTGNVGTCAPGTMGMSIQDATLLRLQYFRAMTGLPTNNSFDSGLNAKCQEAALMMTANGAINHFPPTGWTCYSADGAEAAQKSNLALGYSSPVDAMDGWVLDEGITSVGHRRWILFPPQEVLGVGGATGGGSTSSQVLWVFGGPGGFGTRPVSPEWVAWPPAGFVPYQVVGNLWSFSYEGADFSSATVTMSRGGNAVAVSLETLEAGFGDNTLVWTPQGLPGGAPASDLTYTVTLNNVMIVGSPQSFSYDVTVIDPSIMVSTHPITWGAIKSLYNQIEP